MTGKPWTDSDVKALKQYAGQFSDKELAVLLDRTVGAIRQKAHEQGTSVRVAGNGHLFARMGEDLKTLALRKPLAEARKQPPIEIPVEAHTAPVHRIEIITPTMAANWLAHRAKNRSVSRAVVIQYAEAMRGEEWQENSETVKISKDGKLLDGQHRCTACIRANVPFRSWVAYGVEESAFDTIDVGKKRTTGDVLGIKEVPNANAVAAALRIIKTYEAGGVVAMMSAHECAVMVDKHPGIVHSVRFVRACSPRNLIANGPGGAMHYLFSRISPIEADQFFNDLGKGEMLESGDPVYILRNALIADRGSKSRLGQMEIVARIIRAWNYRRKGERITRLVGSVISRTTGSREWPKIEDRFEL